MLMLRGNYYNIVQILFSHQEQFQSWLWYKVMIIRGVIQLKFDQISVSSMFCLFVCFLCLITKHSEHNEAAVSLQVVFARSITLPGYFSNLSAIY